MRPQRQSSRVPAASFLRGHPGLQRRLLFFLPTWRDAAGGPGGSKYICCSSPFASLLDSKPVGHTWMWLFSLASSHLSCWGQLWSHPSPAVPAGTPDNRVLEPQLSTSWCQRRNKGWEQGPALAPGSCSETRDGRRNMQSPKQDQAACRVQGHLQLLAVRSRGEELEAG